MDKVVIFKIWDSKKQKPFIFSKEYSPQLSYT